MGERLGLFLFCLALALAPLLGGTPPGERYGGELLLGGLRFLFFVAAACLPALPWRGSRAAGIALALFVSWGVLSLLVHSAFLTSPVLLFAMLPATLDLLAAGLMVVVAARLSSENHGGLVQGTLLFGLAATALLVAQQYGDARQAGEEWRRATGLFFSPNFAAGFLGLCLPLALLGLARTEKRLAVIGLGVLTALGLGALVATGSRVGVGAAVLGLGIALVLAAWSSKGKLPWARLGIVLFAGLVLAFGFRGALLARSTKTGGQSVVKRESPFVDDFRLWTWRGTAAMAQANPVFGTGPGTFPYRYPRYAKVAQTDLAHHSYLQLAAECGWPAALAATATALLALGAAFRRVCAGEWAAAALVGALVVGLVRGLFDSEWSLLGNALPFWAVVGLALAPAEAPPSDTKRRWLSPTLAGLGALLGLLGLRGSFPTPPTLIAQSGPSGLEEAARIEPTPRWQFLRARLAEQEGRLADAVSAFQSARDADPNSLQTLRALAEAQEKAGDSAGARATWQQLVTVAEGPVGTIRALPEVTETYPAFAYAALARTATPAEATPLWEKCAAVIEAYSRTERPYQEMELGDRSAKTLEKVRARRAEVRALYEEAANHLPNAPKDETLKRLDAFVLPSPG